MTDSNDGHSREIEQEALDVNQDSKASNILADESSTYGTKPADADVGANMEAYNEELKDKVDGAVPTGVKKADATTGGRVFVGETGDLHDLAASRQH